MSFAYGSRVPEFESNQGPSSGDIWASDIGPIADHIYLSNGEELYHSPVVDAQAIPEINGYYLVTADGAIFAFGKAPFHGSLISKHEPPKAAISRLMLRDEFGYALVDEEGNVYPFGDFRA